MAHNEEYDFAYHLLYGEASNDLKELDAKLPPTRDFIFYRVLKEFNGEPVKIFQVGAIETFRFAWRLYSGWSDIIFGEYIKENGGELFIADINMDNIAHSLVASHARGYKIDIVYGDAINHIGQKEYDIYYLDGANDPEETLDQFNKIKHHNAIVIVDDYSIKGTKLPEDLEVEIYDVANKVGVIDLRSN